MKPTRFLAAVILSTALSCGSAQAQSRPGGCLKYGLGGAIAGHFAGRGYEAWRPPCRRPAWRPPAHSELHSLLGWTGLLRSHGSLKSARLRRKSEATSSTLRPCKSTAALRAAIVSLLSWPDSFSKGALICGKRSKVVLRTTGASM